MTIPFCGNARRPDRIPILFFDLEGGFGGSSRSLFYLIEALDPERFEPIVILRKPGPILDRYRSILMKTHIMERIPSFRPGQRKRPVSFALFLFQCVRSPGWVREVKRLAKAHDAALLHVNHESLGLTGYLLSRSLGLPWVCHIRTQLVPSVFGRMVYRIINRHADRIAFITDQNLTHFGALVGKAFDHRKAVVVRNIMPRSEAPVEPLSILRVDRERFKVLSLSNFSPNRGVDRIVDVAEILKRRGRTDFSFYLFGRPAHRNLRTGKADPYAATMKSKVDQSGLSDMVLFPGHTDAPERALAGGDALIKLTREANPWGRDIMEAMAAGLPVVTLGAYEGFVEHGVNGYLELHYRPDRIADFLMRLRDDPSLAGRMAAANRSKSLRLFDGGTNAAVLEEIYESMLGG